VKNTKIYIIFILVIGILILQTVPSLAQVDPPATIEGGHGIWQTRDQNGIMRQMWNLTGHFNVNSKVSASDPENNGKNFDELLNQSELMGFSFLALTDNSFNLSSRVFFLLRGVLLARAVRDKPSIPGFNWTGDAGISMSSLASITVVGCDKFVYYSSGGTEIPVDDKHLELDYILPNMTDADGEPVYVSEKAYVNIISNGNFKFQSSSIYNQIDSMLNEYVEHWTNEGINLDFLLGGETLKIMRKDLEDRFETLNETLGIRTPKVNFDALNNWIQLEGNSNLHLSAMFCYPVGEDSVSAWADEFFKQKYSDNAAKYFTLVEVRSDSGVIDTTLYKTALENGWKVSPVTALNNDNEIPAEAQDFYTGAWSEVPQSTDARAYMRNLLEAFRKRRTFVANMREGLIRFHAIDKLNQIAALTGETITQDKEVIVHLNIGYPKLNDRVYLFKPRLIIVYKDGTTKSYPFVSYYRDITGPGPGDPRIDRDYERCMDSLKNVKCFYSHIDCYEIMRVYGGKEQYKESWSYYKLWKYFTHAKITATHYQMVSGPIFVDI